MAPSPFLIYNASAGSGKTYTLVKEYLKILLTSESIYTFKHILAITFTNKAVAEMKSRILDTLKRFSDEDILSNSDTMFEAISEELKLSPSQIQQKSHSILEAILHNYGAFDISTIDGFTHKIIRTFARDLSLSQNFEVELDTDSLLNEAVDSLISKVGTDKQLTSTLVDYALEKMDDDKSWDINYNLNEISKLLVKENNHTFLDGLREKTLDDFEALKTSLNKSMASLENQIKSEANNILEFILECGLEHSDFNGGARAYLPNYFIKLSIGDFNLRFGSKWQDEIETKPLYPSRVTDSVAQVMDRIQPKLAKAFYKTRDWIFQLDFYKNIYKNTTPLSVLNSIYKEVQAIQKEDNKLLISEFNKIISDEIKNQPTPFIYERLGEKFKHYFIDEFQDTSKLQWGNLQPLIANSIEQEQQDQTGTLLVVGDAKQSIYRWRGGEADQFIDLYSSKVKPFQVDQVIESLDFNFRSFKQIINFNNRFFDYLSKTSFRNPSYGALYQYSKQVSINPEDGFVQLEFLNIEKEHDKNEIYCDAILKTIKHCNSLEYNNSDICILVRKNKEGIAVSSYLLEHGIQVESKDTMLLINSPDVIFIYNLLVLLTQPKNQKIKADVLYYIAAKNHLDDIHGFISKGIEKDLKSLFNGFKSIGIEIEVENLVHEPLFETVENLVRDFNLVESSNAFVQFFMDEVLDFSQKYSSNIRDFIDYFDKKKDTLYITNSGNKNAVKVMTIHKAKGLEFPIVIFPFAELDIYKELKPQVWYSLEAESFEGFPHSLIDYKQDIVNYGVTGTDLYETKQAQLELDNINLLYVALTRPVEQLYIISKKEKSSNFKTYCGLFIEFLKHHDLWQEGLLVYPFGKPEKKHTSKSTVNFISEENLFISYPRNMHSISIVAKSGYLWDTDQAKAIEKGNLIHTLLAKIYTFEDLDAAIEKAVFENLIETNQIDEIKESLLKVLNHESLKTYFSNTYKVFNEQEIISSNGDIFRPDKLVFLNSKDIVLIDFKTGDENPTYYKQLKTYERLLNEMDLTIIKKMLVYIDEEIKIKEL